MKQNLLFTFVFFLMTYTQIEAQSRIQRNSCNVLSEDYTSGSNWTQVGNDVSVVNGRVEYQNDAPCSSQKRVYRTLTESLSYEDVWTVEVDFHVSSAPTGSTGHLPIALTRNSSDPFNDCPDVACTGYPTGTQDCIAVLLGTSSSSASDRAFIIKARDGSRSTEYTSLSRINAIAVNTTYYLRLERLSFNDVKLSVFSDAGRSIHLTGSPITLNIPRHINDFTTVQHSNAARGASTRQLNGWVDNLCIQKIPDPNGSLSPFMMKMDGQKTVDNIAVYPTLTQGKLEFIGVEQGSTIQFIDSYGRVLRQLKIDNPHLDISEFPDGIYFIVIEGVSGEMVTKRIVKS